MVALPGLDTYSRSELIEIGARSPAFGLYVKTLGDPRLDELRARRHRAWCECVAATLLERASTADICKYWSDVADEILSRAWSECGLADLPTLLVGFGKLGAHELNLSSDVDVLVIAESDVASQVLRKLRKFQARVGTTDEMGFCYRLDFDLRPGGRTGPLVTTPSQFQDHYWNHGEPWERLAMVRLRPITGDEGLRKHVEELRVRFTYRRHLDFTLIDDLRVLRAAVHERGFTRRPGWLNLKLEVGGIRDVELFTHLQQVIHGGRVEDLRVRSTSEALRRLRKHEVLDEATATELESAYWRLRDLENRVQLVDDRQTHELGDGSETSTALGIMSTVDQIVSRLLGPPNAEVTELPPLHDSQKAWLQELGFGARSVNETWAQLIAADAHTARAERTRRDFLFHMIRAIAKVPNADRDLGLATLTDFVRATRGKATLFAHFVRRPKLVDDVARFFCVSPYLGGVLAARPELLDQLVRPVQGVWSSDPARLLDQMSERKLLTEIQAANLLMNGAPVAEFCSRMTDAADEIAKQLLRSLGEEFPRTEVDVLTLGKWGGRELGLRSDLDFIFVTETEPSADDLRVARRFITRMTDPSGYGALYDVDLRLRPSGQSGPLMITRAKLREYWAERAAAWERQAYLRSRPLDGPIDRRGLCVRTLTPDDLEELRRIRTKVLKNPTEDYVDLKHAPGGIMDVEFTAQIALLAKGIEDAPSSTTGMIRHLAERDDAWAAIAEDLIAGYDELRRIEQGLQLANVHRATKVTFGADDLSRTEVLLSRADLAARVREIVLAARPRLNRVDATGLEL